MPKKITHLEFIERVKKVHGDKICVLWFYKNSKSKILVKHICGFEWETIPQILWNKHGCPKCLGVNRKNTETFKNDVLKLVGNEYEIIGEYKNTHCKIKFKHNECGNVFEMEPNAFLGGQRCPKERYLKSSLSNSYSYEYINNKIKEITLNEYELGKDFKNSSTKCNIIHNLCGKEFMGTPTRLINDLVGCPNCKKSKAEKILKEILIENIISFKTEYRIKECKNTRPLPFDFAVFENNKLKCLIEYDGIQHFKAKFGFKNLQSTKENDLLKNNFCKKTIYV